ncbi:MAG: hypothetical protein ACRD7E_02940, partial [Bryobacteraceae bacterium]
MKNAHLRIGTLEFRKVTRDTTLSVRVWLDRLSLERESEGKIIRAFIDQKQAGDYANATINRWLEAFRRAYTLGLKELPPLVYV